MKASEKTGRLRIELSHCFRSKEEEIRWFDHHSDEENGDVHKIVIQFLRKNCQEYIKEIPFLRVWDAFWYAPKVHIFIEESHKAAVVYAYNTETR